MSQSQTSELENIFEPLDENTLISQSIVANFLSLFLNEEISRKDYYKKGLKNKMEALIPQLIKAEAEYDRCFAGAERETVQIYKVFEQMVKTIAGLGLHHFDNVTALIEAYKKDPQSISGIANKINRK